MEKTCWSTQVIVFLGMLLDTINQMISIPIDKRNCAVELDLLTKKTSSRKATILQLQQLAGLLNFISGAVVPGRAFTRHIYCKFSKFLKPRKTKKELEGVIGIKSENQSRQDKAKDKKWRKHYHVRIDSELKADFSLAKILT